MAKSMSRLKAYKGPMVVLALSATLIVAMALPKSSEVVEEKPKSAEIASTLDAQVKRLESSVGDVVAIGDPLLTLIDPALESEISSLEAELKQALIGTKMAVAESGIAGSIEMVPKVVWEPAPISGSISPSAAPVPPVSKSASPQVKAIEKDMDAIVAKEKATNSEIMSKDQELRGASATAAQAEAEVASAEAQYATKNAEVEKQQKLYDMGAIPKNKLDEVSAQAEAAQSVVAQTKASLSEASNKQATLQREIIELRAKLSQLRDDMETLRAKLAEVQDEAEIKPRVASVPAKESKPKLRKKIVYTGAQPEPFAPMQVNLVDSVDATETAKIAALREKIIELRKKRERLTIRATHAGQISFLVAPGTTVSLHDRLAVIEFAR